MRRDIAWRQPRNDWVQATCRARILVWFMYVGVHLVGGVPFLKVKGAPVRKYGGKRYC